MLTSFVRLSVTSFIMQAHALYWTKAKSVRTEQNHVSEQSKLMGLLC